jgi:hypothetical protein
MILFAFTPTHPANRKPSLLKKIWRALVAVFDFITHFG